MRLYRMAQEGEQAVAFPIVAVQVDHQAACREFQECARTYVALTDAGFNEDAAAEVLAQSIIRAALGDAE